MTQEDKELLLKDLSARLPYGVKCNALLKQIDGSLKSTFGTFKGYNNGYATVGQNLVDIETVKPYLRPMSSMTEEERKEYYETMDKYTHRLYPNSADFSEHTEYSWTTETFDFLNANHFDYRGLIEKGLAIAVTKENNPYEN